MTSTGMFKVLRKRVTFAERDMDVVCGSRGLKVKRSICRIVNKNCFCNALLSIHLNVSV